MNKPLYRRILLKFSGEALAGDSGFGIDPSKALDLASEIKSVHNLGVSVVLVIGAGNIFRGMEAAAKGMDRVTGDYLGMLATVMNSITLQDALENINCNTRTLTALKVDQIAEPYIRRRALRHLEKGRIVIVSGGTGNPFFSTDTGAALRASELAAEVVLKGTKVGGLYDKDPMKHSDAVRYDTITYREVIEKNLRVMDLTAITLCSENSLPIQIFDINSPGYLKDIVLGNKSGTIVSN